MKTSKFLNFYLLALFCISLLSCKSQDPEQDPNLQLVDFLRGEIALCGNNEFGEVKFNYTCDIAMLETFDMAVSLLHSFEYKEAEKAFVKVIDADPDCVMAYWGVAMTIYHALWFPPGEDDLKKGSQILRYAEALPKSKREEDYLAAIAAYYNDWETVNHKTRAKNMEKKMESLYKKYPDDKEAAVFYALTLNSTADTQDKNYTNQRKAGKILETIFPDQPDHPGIAHYIIHNYDNPDLAHMALSTARRYAEIAPSSSHAQHMPSHIFTRLGLWDESIVSNINSASASKCYAEAAGIKGAYFQEIHALDYLVYAYLQQGNNAKAENLYDQIKNMPTVNPANLSAVSYPFAAIPARIALENKNWNAAANVQIHDSDLDWTNFPWQKSMVHFARALGASHTKDFAAAQKEIEILESLRKDELERKDPYKANQIMIEIKASQAWLKLFQGEKQEALTLMTEATDLEKGTEKHPVTPGEVLPAAELLGDMLLVLERPDEALIAYKNSLERSPNRFNGLYGAAIASERSGNTEKATAYFKLLVELASKSEENRTEELEAQQFIASNKIL